MLGRLEEKTVQQIVPRGVEVHHNLALFEVGYHFKEYEVCVKLYNTVYSHIKDLNIPDFLKERVGSVVFRLNNLTKLIIDKDNICSRTVSEYIDLCNSIASSISDEYIIGYLNTPVVDLGTESLVFKDLEEEGSALATLDITVSDNTFETFKDWGYALIFNKHGDFKTDLIESLSELTEQLSKYKTDPIVDSYPYIFHESGLQKEVEDMARFLLCEFMYIINSHAYRSKGDDFIIDKIHTDEVLEMCDAMLDRVPKYLNYQLNKVSEVHLC